MRSIIVLLVLAASCSPPASEPSTERTRVGEAPVAAEPPVDVPDVDYGPYRNTWDAAELSRFRHTLHARTPGDRTVTLQAQTDAPGGETVAVYPVGPDGQRSTRRIVFAVADRDGESASAVVEVPAEGLQVEVVVENAGGRRHAGSYALSVAE